MLLFNLILAGLAPLLSALIPKFVYRQGLSAKANYVMLGISAGLLFSIATVDLIPEAMNMTQMDVATTHVEHEAQNTGEIILPPPPNKKSFPTSLNAPLLAPLHFSALQIERVADHDDEHEHEGLEGSLFSLFSLSRIQCINVD